MVLGLEDLDYVEESLHVQSVTQVGQRPLLQGPPFLAVLPQVS